MRAQRRVPIASNVIQAGAGGWLFGSLAGVLEAGFHTYVSGAPDGLAPLYALVLYGLVGLLLGLTGGFAFSLLNRFKDFGRKTQARAFASGIVCATVPIAFFVGFYLVRKHIFHEASLSAMGWLGLAGGLGLWVLFVATWGTTLLHKGPGRFLLKGPGALGVWASLFVLLGIFAFVRSPADPRTRMATGKPIPAALADSPNVLVFTVDTLRLDALSGFGNPNDPTPAISNFFQGDSVRFWRAYSAASWTRSSFATMFAGRLPAGHGADTKASRLPEAMDLISEVAQAQGVSTGFIANNINVTSTFGFDQGWDTMIYEAPAYVFGGTESVFELTLYKVLHKIHEKLVHTKEVSRFYQPAEVVLADAKRFIEANAGTRWMLVVHLMEPHDPYFRHPYLRGEGEQEYDGYGFARAEVEHPDLAQAAQLHDLYRDEVRHLDRKLEPFFAWLESSGTLKNTAVLLTSDHGEEFGEHGGFWHGQTLYDEQLHVPLLMRVPGLTLRHSEVLWPVSTLDVAPTLAGILKIAPSEQWEGRDLVADLQGRERQIVGAMARQEELQTALQQALPTEDSNEADHAEPSEPEGGEAEAHPDAATSSAYIEQLKRELSTTTALLDVLTRPRLPEDCEVLGDPLAGTIISQQDFEGNVLSSIRARGVKLIDANLDNTRGLPTRAVYDVTTDAGEQQNLAGSGKERVCGTQLTDLVEELTRTRDAKIEASAQGRVEEGVGDMTQSDKCRLCVLGYMSGAECEGC